MTEQLVYVALVSTATAPGEPTAWANNIAAIFLNPFGIGSGDSSVSANGTNGRILQQTRKKLMPGFPISVACNNNRFVKQQHDRCIFCSLLKLAAAVNVPESSLGHHTLEMSFKGSQTTAMGCARHA